MKKLFSLITVLITISLIGIIVIQFSWLKNVTKIQRSRVTDLVEVVAYEVVEALVEEKMQYVPSLPAEVLPQGSQEQIREMLSRHSLADQFSVEDINKRIEKSFADNGLKGAKFQFAVFSNSTSTTVDMSSPDFWQHYESATKDSVNYTIHNWPLVNLTGDEIMSLDSDERLVLITYDMNDFVMQSVGWMIVIAIFFTLVITAAFYVTIRTILTQKKLSEMKTDFINNMTHELRTPLATISIAVDTLRNEKIIGNREQLLAIGQVIKTENARMNTQVEQILQAAQLDINQVLKDKQDLHVHEVLQKIEGKFALQVAEKDAKVIYKMDAEQDLVVGHPVHFVNMISNLFDNALKYAREDIAPEIEVATFNKKNKIVITIKDNGIGMTKETLTRIFDKFYRAHTGNVHNVKGFGLGLNYTRKMVEAHEGTIEVTSKPGSGSQFTISLPLKVINPAI
jgi:two-component system phosphate regulon sensor histidine kinase PhoR